LLRKLLIVGVVLVLAGAASVFLGRRLATRVIARIGAELTYLLEADTHDIARARQRRAADEAAEFVDRYLPQIQSFRDRFEVLEHSLGQVDPGIQGLYCEFGVATGTTINFIANHVRGEIHGFDSFEGLPETWRDGFSKGRFSQSGLPAVRANVRLYKGWFHESLPGFLKDHPGPAAFLHMDADLYSSTKTVLDLLEDRIVPGTVIVFDEYFNYPGWRQGEYRAFQEFVDARGVKFDYLAYCRYHEQVSVKIRSISARRGR
jgi:methyltransferase family protein